MQERAVSFEVEPAGIPGRRVKIDCLLNHGGKVGNSSSATIAASGRSSVTATDRMGDSPDAARGADITAASRSEPAKAAKICPCPGLTRPVLSMQ